MNMSNIGTTSIDNLPISPQTQSQDNIKLNIDDSVSRLQQTRDADLLQAQQNQPQQQFQPAQNQPAQQFQPAQQNPMMTNAMSQQTMNQFVSGLQQASAAGLTTLPSRDIPQTQSHLTQDQQMQPNYIPREQINTDYITEHQTNDDILRKQAQKDQHSRGLDTFYNNLQTPILIAILYFLFQLPIVRKNIFKFAPSLFSKDGNPNLMGYVMNSTIFAALYFGLTRSVQYFSL